MRTQIILSGFLNAHHSTSDRLALLPQRIQYAVWRTYIGRGLRDAGVSACLQLTLVLANFPVLCPPLPFEDEAARFFVIDSGSDLASRWLASSLFLYFESCASDCLFFLPCWPTRVYRPCNSLPDVHFLVTYVRLAFHEPHVVHGPG
jgi:hypothetical protein